LVVSHTAIDLRVNQERQRMLNRIFIALLLGTGIATAQSGQPARPLVISDTGAKWFESRAWGGGVTVRLALPEKQPPGVPSLSFLSGAAPELVFGCNSRDPARSHWRFRAGFSPPGSMNNVARAERAYEEGVARLMGTQGRVILFDELDKPVLAMHLFPVNGGLETSALSPAQTKEFRDASAIRVESPQIVIEARMDDLGLTLLRVKNPPCERAATEPVLRNRGRP
jgi:hypothetical protein